MYSKLIIKCYLSKGRLPLGETPTEICACITLHVCLYTDSLQAIGLVYWGLTPQQQPGSYRGGDYDDNDKISVLLVEETGAPGGKHRPTASN